MDSTTIIKATARLHEASEPNRQKPIIRIDDSNCSGSLSELPNTIRASIDSGRDNPFKPDGLIYKLADPIVDYYKFGPNQSRAQSPSDSQLLASGASEATHRNQTTKTKSSHWWTRRKPKVADPLPADEQKKKSNATNGGPPPLATREDIGSNHNQAEEQAHEGPSCCRRFFHCCCCCGCFRWCCSKKKQQADEAKRRPGAGLPAAAIDKSVTIRVPKEQRPAKRQADRLKQPDQHAILNLTQDTPAVILSTDSKPPAEERRLSEEVIVNIEDADAPH